MTFHGFQESDLDSLWRSLGWLHAGLGQLDGLAEIAGCWLLAEGREDDGKDVRLARVWRNSKERCEKPMPFKDICIFVDIRSYLLRSVGNLRIPMCWQLRNIDYFLDVHASFVDIQ